ncbi:MAG: hypothetical protein ABH837_02845 [bacterium]
MPINLSINDIMRESFPFLKKILTYAQPVTSFQIYNFLPPQALMAGSCSIHSKKHKIAVDKQIYVIDNSDQIITMVPECEFIPLDSGVDELDIGARIIVGQAIGDIELLCMTILDHLDSDIRYVVIVEADFRVDGFDKSLDTRIVEIFEVDPDTLESDCRKAKSEFELLQSGKRLRDLN